MIRKFGLLFTIITVIAVVFIYCSENKKTRIRKEAEKASDKNLSQIKNDIKEYLVSTTVDSEAKLQKIDTQNLTLSELEIVVNSSKQHQFKRPSKRMYKDSVDVKGFGKVSFFVYLPKAFDRKAKYPLLVGLPGSSGTEPIVKCTYGRLWSYSNPKAPMIKVMLIANGITFFNGNEGLVMPVLLKILNEYNIDRNRMYIGGTSNGGVGAFHIAVRSPHLWAGCMGVPGGFFNSDNPKEWLACSQNTSYYLGVGQFDSSYWFNKYQSLKKVMSSLDISHEIEVMENQGHFFSSKFDNSKLINWLLTKKRSDSNPLELSFIVDNQYLSSCSWLSVNKYRGKKAKVSAKINRELNMVVIKGDDVEELTVYLSPKLFDKDRELTVRFNEKIVFEGKLVQNKQSLLKTSRYNFQTGFNFTHSLTIRSTGDVLARR